MLKAVHAQEDAQAAREKSRTGGGEAEGDEVGAGRGDGRSQRGRNAEGYYAMPGRSTGARSRPTTRWSVIHKSYDVKTVWWAPSRMASRR